MRRLQLAVVAVGDELLRGDVVDTHGAELARWAAAVGLPPGPRYVVGDRADEIAQAVRAAAAQATVVAVAGGLGPTPDDVTRDGVAAAAGLPLVRHTEAEAALRSLYARRSMRVTEGVLRQAQLPAGSEPIANEVGTACGFSLDHDGVLYIVLPGPPRELRPMGPEVRRRLAHRFPDLPAPATARLQVAGYGESAIANRAAEALAAAPPFLSWATYLKRGAVELRLAATPEDAGGRAAAARAVAEAAAACRAALHPWVYGDGETDVAAAIAEAAGDRGWLVSVAESCTAGDVAARLAGVAGASNWFPGGLVAYRDDVKQRMLGVSQQTLTTDGAVSAACAREMASGARRTFRTDVAISVTGYAGPSGGDERSPVGTVFIGWSDAAGEGSVRRLFHGPRNAVRERAAWDALVVLWARLHDLAPPG